MRRLFSNFAHGAPGIGLLLLRLTAGGALIYQGVTSVIGHTPIVAAVIHALVILLGVLLLAGLWTPVAGALGAMLTIWEMVSHPASPAQCVSIAIIAVALALLGPGAWSVDAWLYGWRQIRISNRRRSGQDDSPV